MAENLEWDVYVGDFNSRTIKQYNIFRHWSFTWDIERGLREIEKDKDLPDGKKKEAFEECVMRNLRYYFWSKCEWEVIISHWPPSETFRKEKVDVYDQVMLNWDKFIDYVWENRGQLKALARERRRNK